jgi:hypothetical protein
MAKKPQTPAKASKKSVGRADDLTATSEGGIELTEAELSRASGGVAVTGNLTALIKPQAFKIA